ncbi:MAG TPA: carboxypeptidase regulatory-like domain-containing protein [Archangium sp.]|uniref:carboxypeptidase regulatory-like domain-containing protein n=1 Tax=Archangium sp. TaxID=1872627 RepID=UPI002EDAD77F
MGRGALIPLLLLVAPLAFAQQGTVRGEVRLTVSGADGRPVAKTDRSGVVVYLTGYTEPPPAAEVNMAQRNKAFQPSVVAVVAGQKVRFSNNDVVVHNVFSRSRARKFDAGKNRPGEDYTETFKKTGLIDVYCDIHEQMVATIVVVPNRAFAVTGPDGRFVLKGVPPGTHPIFAVHRRDGRSEVTRGEVTVKPGQETTVTLELVETKTDEGHLDKHGRPYTPRSDAY